MKSNMKLTLACAFTLCLNACSDAARTASALDDYPAVAALALEALPDSLQGSEALALKFANRTRILRNDFSTFADNDATHIEAFLSMFTETYPAISGTSAAGMVNSLLNDMDSRFAELAGRFEVAPDCTTRDAESYDVDLSSIATGAPDALKITLDVQCRDLFNTGNPGELSGEGSGLLFGKDGDDYSIMLVLNEKDVDTSGFGYAAKVTNKGADDERVDMIFGEARPVASTTGQRQDIARVVAMRKLGIYELLLASTTPTTSNAATAETQSNMGCGLRGLTNGTLVYVTAEYAASGGCTGTNNVQLCLNASDLTAASGGISDCTALKATMTLGTFTDLESIDSDEVTNADSETIFTAIQIDNDALDEATAAVSE